MDAADTPAGGSHANGNSNKSNNSSGNKQKQKQKSKEPKPEAPPAWLHDNADGTKSVFEGSAEVVFDGEVFYNPVQQFNRDMSIAAISTWRDMFFLERAAKAKRKMRSKLASSSANPAAEATEAAEAGSGVQESQGEEEGEQEQSQEGAAGSNSMDATADAAAAQPANASKDAVKRKAPGSPQTDEAKAAARKRQREEQKTKALKQAASTVSFERVDLAHADYADQRFSILEALSATGLRSIRYAKEIDSVGEIIANDLDAVAVKAIERNVAHNKAGDIIKPNQGDATQVMYRALGNNLRYDVVDLDPYGSASPFLDSAVQAVSDGGLLCVTCTDLAVLAGSQPESCWMKYGGINIPGTPYTHEMALRILLHAIQSAAARCRRGIEPLLSCSIDFYVRVFVREAASKSSLVYHCTGCKSFVLQPLGKVTKRDTSIRYGPSLGPTMDQQCIHCGNPSHVGGPFYNGPIHHPEFMARMLDRVAAAGPTKFGTHSRMAGMLTVQSEFILPLVASSAILHAGFAVSESHAAQGSIKTTAPPEVVWDIMRCWCKTNPPTDKNLQPNSPARRLLATEPKIVADFSTHPNSKTTSRKFNLVRYQENPTANWGPKARPKKAKQDDDEADANTKRQMTE
ncbi:N2,N2-dimethylguanosine tRNA methyltransferase-domain-containing protein [Entophlyctis helioformis]|nr:N2,N2-dimethylguanosine tRNA methyltransferase-domain-containing protein [Entophlyctis helioformis]